MSFISPIDERVYVQFTTPWASTIPNSSGTPTLAAADAVRHVSCRLSATCNLVPSVAKTGSLGRLVGQKGRRLGSFELTVPLQGSGTAGTAADMDPLWTNIFGQAGTVVSSTSITYSIAETVTSLTIWKFRDPAGSNIYNEVLTGGVITDWEVGGGDEAEATLTVRGVGVFTSNKPNFTSMSTTEKGGISAFPSEPSSVTYLGTPALAFVGSFSLNAVTSFSVEKFRVFGSTGRSLRPAFGSYNSTVPIQGPRTIGCDFSLYEEDTSAMATLRHKSYSKASFAGIMAIGETAGNIHTFNLGGLTLGPESTSDNGAESIVSFSGNEASMSALGANDELTYVAT